MPCTSSFYLFADFYQRLLPARESRRYAFFFQNHVALLTNQRVELLPAHLVVFAFFLFRLAFRLRPFALRFVFLDSLVDGFRYVLLELLAPRLLLLLFLLFVIHFICC